MFFRGGQDYFYFHRDNLLDHFHTTCFFGICYFPGKQGPYENHNLAFDIRSFAGFRCSALSPVWKRCTETQTVSPQASEVGKNRGNFKGQTSQT